MTAGNRREKAFEHMEDAVQADDSKTKNYHVRAALQFLRFDDETDRVGTDGPDESAE